MQRLDGCEMSMVVQKQDSSKAMLHYLIHGRLPGWFENQNESNLFLEFKQKLTERRITDQLFRAFSSVSARARFVSIAENQIDKIVLQLTDVITPFHKQLVSDLLIFHVHVKIRLGVSDSHFYEKLLLTLRVNRREDDQKAFLFFFMKEMEKVSGKEIRDIARMLQGSLMLKRDSLKVVSLYFWKETFSDLL